MEVAVIRMGARLMAPLREGKRFAMNAWVSSLAARSHKQGTIR